MIGSIGTPLRQAGAGGMPRGPSGRQAAARCGRAITPVVMSAGGAIWPAGPRLRARAT